MKRIFRCSVTAGVMAAVLGSACGLLDQKTVIDTDITTDRLSYETDDSVRLTVANRSGDIIYFFGRGIINLQEIEGNDIINEWTVHGFEFIWGSTSIMSGDSVPFTIHLGWQRTRLENARLDESVQYRLYVQLYADKARKQPLTTEKCVSNTFTIVR